MAQYRLKYEFAHRGQTGAPGYDPTYYDYTDFIEQPDKVTLSFGTNSANNDVIDSTGVTRSLVSEFVAFGDLYIYLKKWLYDNPYSNINTILVKVTDVKANGGAGKSLGTWQIEESDIVRICENTCELNYVLNEYSPEFNCLQSTLIIDNHRNWFPEDNITWGLFDLITGFPLFPYLHPIFRYCDEIRPQAWANFIFVFAQSVIGFLVSIVTPIVAIDALLGGTLQEELEDKIENFLQVYLGCNRMHPAPFVRTYFENACSKCGVTFESDIFNSPGGVYGQHYYNTAMAYAPIKDGLREEQEVITLLKGNRKYNKPTMTALEYAYLLKDHFNMKYRLEGNIFKFNHKHTFPTTIIFDFTGDDRDFIDGEICYRADNKIEASLMVTYADDTKDYSGNSVRHRYDGAVDWNEGMSDIDRERFEGINKIEATELGCTRYARDGVTKELAFNFDFGALSLVLGWTENAMLLTSDFTSTYHLMIYNPDSPMQDAAPDKVDITYYDPIDKWQDDWIGESGFSLDQYFMYNPALAFSKDHSELSGHFNLYDLHKMDNPTISGVKKRKWTVTLTLCSAVIERIIDDSPDGLIAHLDYLVQLDANTQGAIESVNISYDSMTVQLSGVTKYV